MKMKFLTLLVFFGVTICNSQVVLDTSYFSSVHLIKLSNSGYKYRIPNLAANTFTLNNIDHTPFITINVPIQANPINKLGYISETLFDNDPEIEYLVYYYVSPPNYGYLYVYDEFGNTEFFQDSVGIGTQPYFYGINIVENHDLIYFDGTNTKMSLFMTNGNTNIYNLGGSIPCYTCESGTVVGIEQQLNPDAKMSLDVYPNPSTNSCNIKYNLDGNTGEIEIINSIGTVVQKLNVVDGEGIINFQTSQMVTGTYFVRLINPKKGFVTKKLLLVQ